MHREIIADRYRITEKTFSGRGWSSFRALDTVLGTEVEVDIVSAPRESLPVTPERLREILQAALQVRGPHVYPLFTWGEEDDFLYLVRERAEGTPLPEVLSLTGNLPTRQVREIAAAAVEVLSEAYGAGLYYLGLNPGQVLVDRCGTPRFLRVGYGWLMEDIDPGEAARVSPYRAPETDGGVEGTRISDVFSLAVMLSEMLPEEGKTERLRVLLKRAVDPLPRQRPSSPRLLLEELESFLPGQWHGDGEMAHGEAERGRTREKADLSPEIEARKATFDFTDARPDGLRRGWGKRLVLMAAGGLIVWLIFSAVSGLLGGKSVREDMEPGREETEVVLPDLQGMTLQEAREMLEELGLSCSVREAPSRLWSAGRVVAQEPAAGENLDPGDTVRLVVSSGRGEEIEPRAGEEGAPPLPEKATSAKKSAGSTEPTTASTSAPSFPSATPSRSGSRAPRATAVLSTLRGPAPLYVRMDAGGSHDPDGDIARFVWRCGDGTTLEGKTVQHVFDPPVIPARFQVVLEVYDSRGLSDRTAVTVEVY